MHPTYGDLFAMEPKLLKNLILKAYNYLQKKQLKKWTKFLFSKLQNKSSFKAIQVIGKRKFSHAHDCFLCKIMNHLLSTVNLLCWGTALNWINYLCAHNEMLRIKKISVLGMVMKLVNGLSGLTRNWLLG